MRRFALLLPLFSLPLLPSPAPAHVAEESGWRETYARLVELVPDAEPDGWRILRYRLSRRERDALERSLGFALAPEDLRPLFFVGRNAERDVICVVMFVTPTTDTVVGVAVDPRGRVARVRPGLEADDPLAAPSFLRQFAGRTIGSSFEVGDDGLEAPRGDEPRRIASCSCRSCRGPSW